jgi:hypothetical protein
LPEVIGEKVDKRTLRKTGRTEQFATRVSKEWLEKIKELAQKENLKLVEVLEKLLECYDKQRNTQYSHREKTINTEKSLNDKKEKPVSQPINKSPTNTKYSQRENNYLLDEEIYNLCSFRITDEQKNVIACEKPLFDKKKALCRSHNRQVRKRFHEFVKDKSIGSTGA